MLPDLQALQDLPARAILRLREAGTCAAMLLAAAILILAACGLGLAALYMWLETEMANYQAALITAAVPLLVGAVIVMRALAPRRPRVPPPTVPLRTREQALAQTAEQTGAAAARATISELQSHPAATLAAALAVGIMAGMISSSTRE